MLPFEDSVVMRLPRRKCSLTPFGLRRVTLVMPGTCFKPSLPMAFRAFFSLRLWTATAEPAGIVASPPSPASLSESDELSSPASSAVAPPFLVSGSSSGSSSILGFDIVGGRWLECSCARARSAPELVVMPRLEFFESNGARRGWVYQDIEGVLTLISPKKTWWLASEFVLPTTSSLCGSPAAFNHKKSWHT